MPVPTAGLTLSHGKGGHAGRQADKGWTPDLAGKPATQRGPGLGAAQQGLSRHPLLSDLRARVATPDLVSSPRGANKEGAVSTAKRHHRPCRKEP